MKDTAGEDNVEGAGSERRMHQVSLDELNSLVASESDGSGADRTADVGSNDVATELRQFVGERAVPASGVEHELSGEIFGRKVHLSREPPPAFFGGDHPMYGPSRNRTSPTHG